MTESRELFWKGDRQLSRQLLEMSGRMALTSRYTPITHTSIQVSPFNRVSTSVLALFTHDQLNNRAHSSMSESIASGAVIVRMR